VLPSTLNEAMDELAKDEVVRGALGDHIYSAYERAKRSEWEAYRLHVTNWELERYLETT
jgi:glutamine synthetase